MNTVELDFYAPVRTYAQLNKQRLNAQREAMFSWRADHGRTHFHPTTGARCPNLPSYELDSREVLRGGSERAAAVAQRAAQQHVLWPSSAEQVRDRRRDWKLAGWQFAQDHFRHSTRASSPYSTQNRSLRRNPHPPLMASERAAALERNLYEPYFHDSILFCVPPMSDTLGTGTMKERTAGAHGNGGRGTNTMNGTGLNRDPAQVMSRNEVTAWTVTCNAQEAREAEAEAAAAAATANNTQYSHNAEDNTTHNEGEQQQQQQQEAEQMTWCEALGPSVAARQRAVQVATTVRQEMQLRRHEQQQQQRQQQQYAATMAEQQQHTHYNNSSNMNGRHEEGNTTASGHPFSQTAPVMPDKAHLPTTELAYSLRPSYYSGTRRSGLRRTLPSLAASREGGVPGWATSDAMNNSQAQALSSLHWTSEAEARRGNGLPATHTESNNNTSTNTNNNATSYYARMRAAAAAAAAEDGKEGPHEATMAATQAERRLPAEAKAMRVYAVQLRRNVVDSDLSMVKRQVPPRNGLPVAVPESWTATMALP